MKAAMETAPFGAVKLGAARLNKQRTHRPVKAAMETAPFGAVKPSPVTEQLVAHGIAAMETAPFGAVKR